MVALLRFCFKKTTLKSKFSEFLFTSKRPLGGYFHWNACAYFQKICCLTRYSNTKLIETFQTIWSHSSVFAFEEQLKNLNFQSFLPLRDPLVATFSETCAPTSRKYVAEQGIVMLNWSKHFKTFWSHSSIFALEK